MGDAAHSHAVLYRIVVLPYELGMIKIATMAITA